MKVREVWARSKLQAYYKMDSMTGSMMSRTKAPNRDIVVSTYGKYEDQPRNEVNTGLRYESR